MSPVHQQGLWMAATIRPSSCLPCACINFHTHRFVAGQGDFTEGVTATLIDRGRQPVWKYLSVGQVPGKVVNAFFQTEDSLLDLQVKPNSRM